MIQGVLCWLNLAPLCVRVDKVPSSSAFMLGHNDLLAVHLLLHTNSLRSRVIEYINVPLSTYCIVKFDTYRNLQRHCAVRPEIARLSCKFLCV